MMKSRIEIHSKMESLQAELIMDILSRVPALELPKLRCICKRWNNILNDPLFPRIHHSHSMSKPNENGVLVMNSGSGLYLVDLSDRTSPRQIAIDLPFVPDFYYLDSCNGLLCLSNMDCSLFFIVNPITRRHVSFLMDQNMDRYRVSSCGFGFDEINNLFKVVVIVSNLSKVGHFEVRIYDLGKGKSTNWRNSGVTNFRIETRRACFLNRRLHWPYSTDYLHGIISYDLTNEEFRPIPTSEFLCDRVYFNIIVLHGCLSIFDNESLEPLKLQIWVMEDYGIEASWVKKFELQPLIPRTPVTLQRLGPVSLLGLGSVKDGELVVSSFHGIIFVSFDSTCDEVKHLQLERPAFTEGSIIHVASLNWI